MEALQRHRQWLVNFRRDICWIGSTAHYNHNGELVHRVSSGLRSEDQYPLLCPAWKEGHILWTAVCLSVKYLLGVRNFAAN